MRRIWPALVALCVCIASFPVVRGQDGAAPRLDAQAALPGGLQTKLPQVVLSGRQAHVAGNARRLDVNYWAASADGAFGLPERIGAAEGQPDYSSAAIAAGPDGALYIAWINQPERTIYLRKRPVGGTWSNPTIVVRGATFPVNVALAVGADTIFVAWRNPDQPFTVSRSTDRGVRWSAPQPLGRTAGYNAPSLAAAGNRAAIAYTRGEADQLQIYAGLWDGQAFAVSRVTPLNASYADPGIAIAPDGRVIAAWRGIADSGPASGVFLAERTADGSWPIAQVIAGKVIGPVTPVFDAAGGLHLFWLGEVGGTSRLWYAQQLRGGAWSAPVSTAVPGGALFNAHGAVGEAANGLQYGQAVSELFLGDRLSAYTFRFVTGGAARPSATPILANGRLRSSATTVALNFSEVSGAPAELRWRWGAPPTDTDPWHPFGPTSLEVPAGAGRTACEELRLFTQVRGATGVQEPAAQTTITIDRTVQAVVRPHNPDGLPGYSRTPTAWLAIENAGECSAITTVSLNGTTLQFDATAQRLLQVPLAAEEGAQTITLRLTDGLGNARDYTQTIIYDATGPLIAGGELALSADPRATVLQRLQLQNLIYRDAASTTPWALAVAAAPTGDAPGAWQTLPLGEHAIVRNADSTLAIDVEVSLATLLPADLLRPGAYTLHVRLIDPAGNPGPDSLTVTLELLDITYPELYLPALRR
jgi:hypothetical protein